MRVKKQVIEVRDYGDRELNRLAILKATIAYMSVNELERAVNYLKSYCGQSWPRQ